MKKVWIFTRTDDYPAQCTGFGQSLTLLAVFTEKPTPTQVAPMMGNFLPKEMGEAVGAVLQLIESGCWNGRECTFALAPWETNTLLSISGEE